ncbi:MAG TPA: pyridoxamine 5'-phosphate oxidase family protein, partial [Syntrophorhabdaceae bacterium]|nr:pyridoxamine 5'-phosphate oxidase family protein [Syntrophorhabdaceae bacterium]HPU29165.1 pyridoxamine 5'-phosphate oxidase family protein [Syntrophorhabdaceae bacterium]
MKLNDYFEQKKGIGILATADAKGIVNVAIYSRPHFIDEETIAFIMADRLTHKNLETNPYAAFLFKEDGENYVGKRLYLTKIKEEANSPLIETLRRKKTYKMQQSYERETKYLVYFHIDKVLPLIGDGS